MFSKSYGNSMNRRGTEPVIKSFMDSEVNIDFSSPATLHDRALLVEGKTFYVNSTILSQFSEFFNGLFNSSFKEKDEKEIELKDIQAIDFSNFLRALYPVRFRVTSKNLAGLMQLSCRFLCPTVWSRCLAFLRNRAEFKRLEPRDLLDWSSGIDSQEIKTMVEMDLIEKNRTNYQAFHNFNECFVLAQTYGLHQLKTFLEERLIWKIKSQSYSFDHTLYLCDSFDLKQAKSKLNEFLANFDPPWCEWTVRAMRDVLTDKVSFFAVGSKPNSKKVNLQKTQKEKLSTAVQEFGKTGNSMLLGEAFRFPGNNEIKFIIEGDLLDSYTRKVDYQLEDILQFIEEFHIDDLKKCVDAEFCSLDLIDPHCVYEALKVLESCTKDCLPNLAEKVQNFVIDLLNQLDHKYIFPPLEPMGDEDWVSEYRVSMIKYLGKTFRVVYKTEPVIEDFIQLARQYNIDNLQAVVLTYLKNDFKKNNNLKFMDLAIKYNLVEFKTVIASYLVRVNKSYLSAPDKERIINASAEVKEFAIRNLFNM